MPKASPPNLQDAPREGQFLAKHYERGIYIEPHSHEWAQVLYATAGVMRVEVDHDALLVPPQRAVWIPAGAINSIYMTSAVNMRNLYLPLTRVHGLSSHSGVFEVSGLLKELIIAISESERSESFLEAAYQLVVMELAQAPRYALRIRLPSSGDRRLEVMCRAVMDNPSLDTSFEQHSAAVGASVRTLSRLFVQELGVGFSEWRRQVQLAIAVSQLAEGRSVSTVARSLGYLPSSFSDMFHRELGASPKGFQSDETLAAGESEQDGMRVQA